MWPVDQGPTFAATVPRRFTVGLEHPGAFLVARLMVFPVPGVLLCKAMASWFTKWGSLSLVASAVLLGAPGVVSAQTDTERAGARATAEAGLSAYNAGRYAEALDLLNRAESIVHALPHLLYMARSADKLGQLIQSREYYLRIGREQLIAGAPRAFIDAQQAAQQELAIVESRLPYLTVNLEGVHTSDCKVTMDDREIPSVLIGVPFPVDPGNHVVLAISSMGQRGEIVKVAMPEGKRERISLKVPTVGGTTPVAPAATANPQPGAAPAAGVGISPANSPIKDQPSKGGSPALAYTALGIGAVGAVVGTIFILQRGSKQSDADKAFDDCKTRYCNATEQDSFVQLDKDAAKAGTISMIGFSVGAVGIAAGLYLLFTGNSKTTTAQQTQTIIANIGPTHAGATLRF